MQYILENLASKIHIAKIGIAKINGLVCIIASEASFLVCSMPRFSLYIYIIYISGRTLYGKCSKCFCVSKYPPNVIFRNANINTTRKRNRLNEVTKLPM